MQSLLLLRALIDRLPARLTNLSDDQVQRKPSSSQWSLKEELGHLLDSAANNHQRIVRAQLEDNPGLVFSDCDLGGTQSPTAGRRRSSTGFSMVEDLHYRRFGAADATVRFR